MNEIHILAGFYVSSCFFCCCFCCFTSQSTASLFSWASLNKQLTSTLCTYFRVAQSVTCLAIDASLTADPRVASSIPAQSYTFVEIDHEIISTGILFPSPDTFKRGCELQAKVCAQSTGLLLVQACPGKSVVR